MHPQRPAHDQAAPSTGDLSLSIGMVLVVLAAICAAATPFLLPWGYALMVCLAFSLGLIVLLRPKWSPVPLILLIPFTTASLYFSPKASWNFDIAFKGIDLVPVYAFIVFAAGIGFLLKYFTTKGKACSGVYIALPVLLILTYAAITVFFSNSMPHSFFQFLILTMNVTIFFLVAGQIRNERDLRLAISTFIFSGLLQAGLHALFFFLDPYTQTHQISATWSFTLNIMGGFFQSSGMPMVDGGFMDHHELALLANLTLAMAFGTLLNQTARPPRLLLILLMTGLVLVILHTQSRAGVGALIVMSSAGLWFAQSTRRYFCRGLLSFILIIIAAYYLQGLAINEITAKETTPRLFVLGSKMVKTRDVIDPGIKIKQEGRTQLWVNSFKKFKDSALTGFGVGNLKKVSKAPHAHSIFLSFLFDFGVVGLLVIAWIVGALTKRIILLLPHQRSYPQKIALASGIGLVAIAFHGQFDFEYNTTLLWLYLGLTVASHKIALQNLPMESV